MSGAEEALLLCADARPAPVIVVRTQRLARLLRFRIAELRESQGRTVAETPDILTIDHWVQRAWETALPGELLLSEAAELAAWEGIIAADEIGQVLDVGAVASECAAAWKLIHRWSEPDWEREALTAESESFLRWRTIFERNARARRWITTAELPARVLTMLQPARKVEGSSLPLFERVATTDDSARVAPARMEFVGFERIEPYVQRLRDALERAGTIIVDHDLADRVPAAASLRAFATVQDEARSIAREISEHLATEPAARIGVLATDLTRYRDIVEVTFLEELDPAALLPGQELRPRPFDLAGAPSLAEHCVISHALDLLELELEGNPRSLVSRVLLAPYPRSGDECDEELEARSMTEAALRRRNVARIDLSELSRRVSVGAPKFAGGLRALSEQLGKARDAAAPSVVAKRFVHRLRAMGWPGRRLQGDEAVAFARWRDALGDLAALEVVEPVMTETHARRRLRELCMAARVQSPSAGLQVQVMGLLDGAGLRFDRIYVLGMDSVSFPGSLRPNALLPPRWQREHRLPLASAEAELEFAGAVWNRVLRSAAEVRASYSVSAGSDETRSASSFVAALADADEPALRSHLPWFAVQAEGALEPRPVETAVPALVRSGATTMLVAHSRCPFQSLAAIRLGADALEAEQSQPANNTRGELVHAALASVLPRIGSRSALAVTTDRAIAELAVEGAAAALASEKGSAVPETLRDATRAWLQGLVSAWLIYERENRDADWSFEAAEQRFVASFEAGDDGDPIQVTCIVDRMDMVDGGRVLIDYKTGTAAHRASEWSGARPDDAQLPIYAVAVAQRYPDVPVTGLAFARIQTREKLELIGRCDTAQARGFGPPGPRSGDHAEWNGWDEALARMTATLGSLAASFARGDFAVDPLHEAATCRNCRRQRLCRVFEGVAADDGDETEAIEES